VSHHEAISARAIMTPQQAHRRAARRIRRRRRRIITRALLILPVLLGAAVLAGDVVEVSKEPVALAPPRLPRAERTGAPPSQPRVPIPVFHPSVMISALEIEIPDVDPLELELLDYQVKKSLERRRLARAEKKPKPEKKPTPEEEPEPEEVAVPEQARLSLIHVAAIEPHLLEIIKPRAFVDPAHAVVITELHVLDYLWLAGWPGLGWVDFTLDAGPGLELWNPPWADDDDDEEEDEKPPPVIPEPGTAALLALGLAAIGFARRRSPGARQASC
jgi:hypothetical protein